MKENPKNELNRREFLKRLGLTSASAALMMGLGPITAFGRDDERIIISNDMTYRINRKTGDKVSLLGYGMMRLPQKNGRIDQDLVNEEVKYALEHGVTYFDTSPHYMRDQSESSLGTALKASGFDRKSYYIATKLSNFGQNEWSFDSSVNMYRNSLKALQTDYIDYYLLHGVGGGGMEQLRSRFFDNGMMDFLMEERAAGRIRNLGFSYHGDVEVFEWLVENTDKYGWSFAQIQMNYVDWKHAKDLNRRNTNAEYLYGLLEKHDIQGVIMEPLLGGRLATLNDVFANRLKELRPNDSMASWGFRFCGSQPNILTSLSGMTYMEHLVDNVKTHSPLEPCTQKELALLEDIASKMVAYPLIPCTDCKYCMPCPYGVNIPANFAYYNKCINEDSLPPVDTAASDFKKKNKKFIKGFHAAVKDNELATKCMDCKECVPKCPQRIRIPQQMTRLTELLERK